MAYQKVLQHVSRGHEVIVCFCFEVYTQSTDAKKIKYSCQNKQYHLSITLYKTQPKECTAYGDMGQKKT